MDNLLPFDGTPISIEEEMKRSFLEYSLSVIVGRALPDARDGLKPVHRRVLYSMEQMGLASNRSYRKCAKIVGEVMGNYHPHGDSAIYDALVRMAQEFNMRCPLVDGQGNFGSIDGDPPAAMRYTEARLASVSREMLADIQMETVDFVPNYDDSLTEPACLPNRVPALLINGSDGIAVGMATKIPPHNLKEVIDGVIQLVEKPKSKVEDVANFIPGPDFPTGGFIFGKSGIAQAYRTGRGSIIIRAKADIEKQTNSDKTSIIITEIPFQVNKARLIEKIAHLVQDKKLHGIVNLRDESDRDGMRIVAELRRGEQPEVVLKNLYKFTPMQTSFGMNMVAIVNKQPQVLNLLSALQCFVDHRIEVIKRRSSYQLRAAQERAHIIEGLFKAIENIDKVIKLIKASSSRTEAREGLMREFDLSSIQAKRIDEMQLGSLAGLEREKLSQEYDNLSQRIAELQEILSQDKTLRRLLVKELKEVQKKYGDERRTPIRDEEAEIKDEDMIPMENVILTLTNDNYVKRTPHNIFKSQHRGGKGRIGVKTRETDSPKLQKVASTHSYLLIFSNQGKVHWLKVYNVPDIGPTGKGRAIVNLVNFAPGEKVATVLPVTEFAEDQFVMFATRLGTVKKTRLTAFGNPRSRGIHAINLDPGDDLIAVELTTGENQIFLGTREGKCIRFHEKNVRAVGRTARGVKGIRLGAKDFLVGMTVSGEEGQILSVTENGYGKRTLIGQYRSQSRGGKGVINIKTSGRNGQVVEIMKVDKESQVVFISIQGQQIKLEAGRLRAIGRSTQGVRLMDLDEGDKIANGCVVTDQTQQLKDGRSNTVH